MLAQLASQGQLGGIIGAQLLLDTGRRDAQDVVHAADDRQLGIGLRGLQGLGIGDADLDVVAALQDQCGTFTAAKASTGSWASSEIR